MGIESLFLGTEVEEMFFGRYDSAFKLKKSRNLKRKVPDLKVNFMKLLLSLILYFTSFRSIFCH